MAEKYFTVYNIPQRDFRAGAGSWDCWDCGTITGTSAGGSSETLNPALHMHATALLPAIIMVIAVVQVVIQQSILASPPVNTLFS
jgi:hypothetical protein